MKQEIARRLPGELEAPRSGEASIDLSPIEPARRRLWSEIIYSAFTVLMREPATGNRLKFQIRAFDEAAGEIPTDCLKECYRRSLEIRDNEGRPVYWDVRAMLAAWHQNAGEIVAKVRGDRKGLAAANADTIANCQRCFGSGWDVSDKRGARRCDHLEIKTDVKS